MKDRIELMGSSLYSLRSELFGSNLLNLSEMFNERLCKILAQSLENLIKYCTKYPINFMGVCSCAPQILAWVESQAENSDCQLKKKITQPYKVSDTLFGTIDKKNTQDNSDSNTQDKSTTHESKTPAISEFEIKSKGSSHSEEVISQTPNSSLIVGIKKIYMKGSEEIIKNLEIGFCQTINDWHIGEQAIVIKIILQECFETKD